MALLQDKHKKVLFYKGHQIDFRFRTPAGVIDTHPLPSVTQRLQTLISAKPSF